MQEIKERKSNNSPGPDSVPPGGHGEQSDRTLSSSTRTSLPPSPVEGNVQAEQKHTDPRLAGTRRLMTETPGPPLCSSPPTNQRRIIHPTALTPNSACENSAPKTIEDFRSFEHQLPVINLYSTPNNHDLVCLASLCVGDMNSGLPKISAAKPHLRGHQLESSHSECQNIPFRATRRPIS